MINSASSGAHGVRTPGAQASLSAHSPLSVAPAPFDAIRLSVSDVTRDLGRCHTSVTGTPTLALSRQIQTSEPAERDTPSDLRKHNSPSVSPGSCGERDGL